MLLDIARTVFALVLCGHLGRQAAWRLGGRSFAERVVIGFVVAIAWATLGGYVLGALHLLASPTGWLVWLAIGALAAGRPVRFTRPVFAVRRWLFVLRRRPLLLLASIAAVFIGATSLAIIVGSAPNNWDAMYYHLARVGYYLQQGSLAPFGANYAWQEQFPKGSAVLLAGLLAVGGKSDFVTGLPQFAAWLAMGAAVHAATRTFGVRHSAAAFAGLVAMLLIIAWLESTTAQNDLLITAEIAASFLFLRKYADARRAPFLILAGVAAGLAVGTKASALTILPTLVLAVGPRLWRFRVALIGALAAAPFVLPSGYVENFRHFGNPLGAEAFSIHVRPDESAAARLSAGARNALRYAFDFATLDQTPANASLSAALGRLKVSAVTALKRIGIDLGRKDDVHMNFWTERVHRPDDNLSYFGPLGLWLLAGFGVACWRRELRWLALAVGFFFAVQCFAGPYDSVRGRVFLYGTVFVLPALGWWVARWRKSAMWTGVAVFALAMVHLVPAAVWRNNFFLVSAEGRDSFWSMDRVQQMTGFHPSYPAERKFADMVPRNARVGVALTGYEYPLFGPHLTRTLVPLLPRIRAGQPLPADLDWIVFEAGALPPQPDDIELGANWFLRAMKQ